MIDPIKNMKRYLLSLVFFIIVFALPGLVSAEEIKSFSSDIKINSDGTIDVKEDILYDFGYLEKHGIYRDIPQIKTNKEGKKYRMDFSGFSVTDENGYPYQYKITEADNNVNIKIGDPNRTISGPHHYLIAYRVAGALTYFSDHDELYWNVTGNGWEVPITWVESKVSLPGDSEMELNGKCYTGESGSIDVQCDIKKNGNSLSFNSANELGITEGFTIVFGFPKNTVAVLEPKPYTPFWETPFGVALAFILGAVAILAGIAWYVVAPVYIIYKWFREGRDPKGTTGIVSAWFDPPKSIKTNRFLTPAEVGTLGDETVDLKDVSAAIIDLARRGYIRIEEREKKDFYLISTTPKSKQEHALLPYEQTLLDKFFKSGTELRLKKAKLYDEVEAVKKDLYEDVVVEGLFPKNPQSTRTIYYVIGGIALFTGNLFLAFVAFVFGRVMPRKTADGVNAKNVSTSLKNFLTSQERQLKFQADKQLMFEKLLPYAVAFGVEKIWAKRFENFNMRQPSWYSSYDHGRFSSYIFVSSMNSSLSSFSRAATPTTSTTGHSSGFSGGFSGGGGGGGGGGSW
ncbi:MAG: DUF2207 domain-containing protein [Patescibacteria group bacterium]